MPIKRRTNGQFAPGSRGAARPVLAPPRAPVAVDLELDAQFAAQTPDRARIAVLGLEAATSLLRTRVPGAARIAVFRKPETGNDLGWTHEPTHVEDVEGDVLWRETTNDPRIRRELTHYVSLLDLAPYMAPLRDEVRDGTTRTYLDLPSS